MEEIISTARDLARHDVYLFFKQAARFRNPLVPSEAELLRNEPSVNDAGVRQVVLEILPGRLPELERGIYSPVPIARSLAEGDDLDDLLVRFRYEMIRVDDQQAWQWQGRPVAERVKAFFTEHLFFEPALGLWYFEYKVNPDWWDKCYLLCDITPLTGTSVKDAGCGLEVVLNSGRVDRLDLETLRLDEMERLFCSTSDNGEILFSDTVRFSLLKGVADDCLSVAIGGRSFPLAWPPGLRPEV